MTEVATATPMIYAKMAAVMADIGGVAKRDRNTHQNFNFRGIDAVMNAVGPVLRQHGVLVVPQVQSVTYDKVTTTGNKPATACRVEMGYVWHAEDGSSIQTSVVGEAWDSGDKAAPKAMSVAFRTALLQALCLPTDEVDPDAQTYEQIRTPMATAEQFAAIGAAFVERGTTDPNAKAQFVATSTGRQTNGSDLTQTEAEKLLTDLRADIDMVKAQSKLNESLGATPIDNGDTATLPPEQTQAAVLVQDPPEEPPTSN